MGEQQKKGQEQDVNQLRKVRREKLADLQANGKNPFEITKYDVTCHAAEVKENYEEMEGKHVSLAGRIMQKRVMGKASFCNILDQSGNIQSYVARDSVGEDNYKDFKKMDIGDIVGIEGEVFKTKTGEISIHASEVKLLSKSLQILPEKYPWADEYGHALPSEICGSDHESGGKRYLYQTFQDRKLYPQVSGWTGIHGSRDSYACEQCRRSGSKTIRDTF